MHSAELEALELTAILDTMAEGVFVLSPEGLVTRWNAAMTRMTGYSREEALNQPCRMLRQDVHPETAPAYDALDCGQIKRGLIDHRETVIRRKDGASVPVIANARPLRGKNNEDFGAVVTFTDVSSLKNLELTLSELREQVETRCEFHNIVGKSHRMQEVYHLLKMAADSYATVLIQGETGTGKELAAQAIHYHSSRRAGPMVSVNCSALSESLLESELFGHVRGAFTGAISDHIGRFERADKGTIFLDEIGELPPLVQVKLLRVLQEREFERVGESKSRKVDVRIIAATNKDLREQVRRGEFREDLFYRLKVFPIELPPLRDRREDIPLLVKRFVDSFNDRTGKSLTGLSPDAMRIVMEYCWPGNVRELENAIEHAFVTCSEGAIGPFDLPVEIRRAEIKDAICSSPSTVRHPSDGEPGSRTVTPVRRKTSRDELLQLLEACEWNKAEVARRLGIDRTSVWRRMKRLGLPLEPPEKGDTTASPDQSDDPSTPGSTGGAMDLSWD